MVHDDGDVSAQNEPIATRFERVKMIAEVGTSLPLGH